MDVGGAHVAIVKRMVRVRVDVSVDCGILIGAICERIEVEHCSAVHTAPGSYTVYHQSSRRSKDMFVSGLLHN